MYYKQFTDYGINILVNIHCLLYYKQFTDCNSNASLMVISKTLFPKQSYLPYYWNVNLAWKI